MYLTEAVQSCFRALPNHSFEIIVVFNGCPIENASLPAWVRDSRIKCTWINERGANLARNHGISIATGSYCMFLDDDDWLHEGKLSEVLEFMRNQDLDVCSCSCEVFENDCIRELLMQPTTDDLVTNVIAFRLLTWTLVNVFKKNVLTSKSWIENIDAVHDQLFLMELCRGPELQWASSKTVLGTYRCHEYEKQSVNEGKLSNMLGLFRLEGLIRLLDTLCNEKRMTSIRFDAARTGVNLCTYQIFASFPFKCIKTILLITMVEIKNGRWNAIPYWSINIFYACAGYLPRIIKRSLIHYQRTDNNSN